MRKLRYGPKLLPGLKVLGLVWMMTAISPAPAAHAAVLWYTGDYDLNDADLNQNNVPINFGGAYQLDKSLVYDSFVVPAGQTWSLSNVFSNDQIGYHVAPTTATWEIRSGMSAGQGGTLLYSGDTAATATLKTAADGNNYIDPEYQISAAVSGVTLSAGTYWMAVAPDSAGYYGDQSYDETTSGANSIGVAAGKNGSSFLNNSVQGSGGLAFAASGLDFSAGVDGTASSVPEPVRVPLLAACAAGVFWLIRRRSRRVAGRTA